MPGRFEWLVVLLKIVPFSFTIVFGWLSRRFEEEWRSDANQYFSELGVGFGDLRREDVEGHYRHITTFTNDRVTVRYVVSVSLLYAIGLYFLAIYQKEYLGFIAPAVGFLVVLVVSWIMMDRWFTIRECGRNPDRYYNHYYEENTNPGIERYYVNHLLSAESDRFISPRKFAFFSQILILAAILVLEVFGGVVAIGVGFLVVFLMCIMIYLVFPGVPYFQK